MATQRTYGLLRCVWRALRAKHWGGDIALVGRDGRVIGRGFLFRYEALVALPDDMDFRAVSWRRTIDHPAPPQNDMIGPTPIPIGAARWG